MRIVLSTLVFLFIGLATLAQGYIGPNFGPLYGRTGDLQFYVYPKNEDWIALSVSGGYSMMGKTYFPRKEKDCLDDLRSGGWHVRVGARNDLTTQNHGSHLFWELLAVYTRHKESALLNTCDQATSGRMEFEHTADVISGAIRMGYTWNPLHKKTIYQVFLLDFGLQIGAPIWSSAPIVQERQHISGIGITRFPFKSIALEPLITFRWKLNKRRYGFSKGRERKRFDEKRYPKK